MLLQENISLKPLHTFGLDVSARYFVQVNTEEELRECLSSPQARTSPPLILGGGSNLLFTGSVDRLVVQMQIGGIHLLRENEKHVWVRVGAGVVWHTFVMHCVDAGWGGVENLALIPGSVGASPMQNIGAYGVEIREVFDSLDALHIHDLSSRVFQKEECRFGYRESIFKNECKDQYVITSVTFRLNKHHTPQTSYGAIQQELERAGVTYPGIREVAEAVIRIRRSKLPDPAVLGNAGSFFKNPEIPPSQGEWLKARYPDMPVYPASSGQLKLAAGWLIEQCGWKGFRAGDAGCHEKQALVLVNHGHATGKEILGLSQQIQDAVFRKFEVRLEREVNVVEA